MMNQPPNTNQNVSSNKTKIILAIIFLAILLLAFGILMGLVLRRSGFQLSLPAVQTQATSTVAPTSLIPPTSVTPEPTLVNPSQLDMLFLKSSVSADQASVTLDIKLTNKGVNPITLKNDDLSITPENGTAAPPAAVIPALPQEIAPGQSLTISVTFPNPKTPSVLLRILDLTVSYSFQ